MSGRWIASENLLLETLSDGYVCFNSHSGETHVFNAFPGQILAILMQRECSLFQLSEIIAQMCGEPGSQEWQAKVERVLADLEHVEVIRLHSA